MKMKTRILSILAIATLLVGGGLFVAPDPVAAAGTVSLAVNGGPSHAVGDTLTVTPTPDPTPILKPVPKPTVKPIATPKPKSAEDPNAQGVLVVLILLFFLFAGSSDHKPAPPSASPPPDSAAPKPSARPRR